MFCTHWNQVPCSGPHWSPTFTWKQGLLWLHPAEGLFSRGWISTQALELESSGGWTSGLTRTVMYLPLKLLISFGCCAPSNSPSLSVSLYLYCSIIWYSCGPCLGAGLWGLLAPLPSISKIWSSPRLPKRSSFCTLITYPQVPPEDGTKYETPSSERSPTPLLPSE